MFTITQMEFRIIPFFFFSIFRLFFFPEKMRAGEGRREALPCLTSASRVDGLVSWFLVTVSSCNLCTALTRKKKLKGRSRLWLIKGDMASFMSKALEPASPPLKTFSSPLFYPYNSPHHPSATCIATHPPTSFIASPGLCVWRC